MTLLFVDALGTRSRLKKSRTTMSRGVEVLEDTIQKVLLSRANGQNVGGAVESDAVALQFRRERRTGVRAGGGHGTDLQAMRGARESRSNIPGKIRPHAWTVAMRGRRF